MVCRGPNRTIKVGQISVSKGSKLQYRSGPIQSIEIIVAYAGRELEARLPKYKLPAGFHKGLELFNLRRAVATGRHTVIVVEGYFDCMRVHQAGFPCVVGLMGSSLSPAQERVLLERFKRVVLMLDGDLAGRNASRVISAELTEKCGVVVVDVPEGVQPDQLSTTVIQNLLSEVIQERSMLLGTGQ